MGKMNALDEGWLGRAVGVADVDDKGDPAVVKDGLKGRLECF